MNNWTKISDEEMKLGMSIANLKKGELQIKYVKDVCRLNNIINELEQHIKKEWNVVEESPETSFYDGYDTCIEEMKKDILEKLKELKEKE